ncbi:hypothetical protein B0J13DRAFT_170994 [Dactylonectria estremocensis]|uniref:Uncharacterized protein n=1 Tax=Dactylonectria estremocensis TaxID=1079267 RepID=A0A9P9JEG0_9HYPO|nr:hypothetical protein B0J13DRAFT_170994 [Dactylonectria estremocensis]
MVEVTCIQISNPTLVVVMPPSSVFLTGFVGAAILYLLTRWLRFSSADLSPIMSPDTVSSLFPDRPIRPLPKRRLRERLSPEVADTIKYPPLTHENSLLFYYPPCTPKDEGSPPRPGSASPAEPVRRNDPGRNYTPRRNGAGLSDGEEEENALRSTLVTRSPPEILTRAARRQSRPDQARHPNPQPPPPSVASSVDGYDSFENTNNKKKRKIPSAGDPTLNGTHALNNDASSLAISSGAQSPPTEVNGDRLYSQTAGYPGSGTFMTNSQGISGPGRGRLGRSRNGRSPLRALSDGNNTWAGRTSKTAPPQWASPERESTGIISNAIANAEKLRPQGQENVSLLQQHSLVEKTTPASTQFTFTCDSQVPGTVQWPGHSTKQTTGTQATSNMAPGANGSSSAAPLGSSKAASRGSGNSRRRGRRRLDKELDTAARHRRDAAADKYFSNQVEPSKIWICEFCEYERIFGEPPRALIREYEMKDRRHRQEEADRKRLLEKAKAKSRKGRKNGKAPAKGSQAAQTPAQGHPESLAEPEVEPEVEPDVEPQLEPEVEPGARLITMGNSRSTQSGADRADETSGRHAHPPLELPPSFAHLPPDVKT